jgi:hypothetical protein
MADTAPQPEHFQPPNLTDLTPFPLTVDAAYDRWLFHGPAFATIERIHGLSPRLLVSDCRPSAPQQLVAGAGAENWLIDPVIFDGALQSIILWARHFLDTTPLPSQFARYRRLGSLAAGQVRCYLFAPEMAGDGMFAVDIAFVDSAGRLIGYLEGMECPTSKALNRLAGAALSTLANAPVYGTRIGE